MVKQLLKKLPVILCIVFAVVTVAIAAVNVIRVSATTTERDAARAEYLEKKQEFDSMEVVDPDEYVSIINIGNQIAGYQTRLSKHDVLSGFYTNDVKIENNQTQLDSLKKSVADNFSDGSGDLVWWPATLYPGDLYESDIEHWNARWVFCTTYDLSASEGTHEVIWLHYAGEAVDGSAIAKYDVETGLFSELHLDYGVDMTLRGIYDSVLYEESEAEAQAVAESEAQAQAEAAAAAAEAARQAEESAVLEDIQEDDNDASVSDDSLDLQTDDPDIVITSLD